jgi:hypothetical protein
MLELMYIALVAFPLLLVLALAAGFAGRAYRRHLTERERERRLARMQLARSLAVTSDRSRATEIDTSAGEIATSAGEIATSAGEIATPAGEIATPAGEIATPAGEIATPASEIVGAASPTASPPAPAALPPPTVRVVARPPERPPEGDEMKGCPDCAEPVRRAARVCRYCGYRFDRAAAPRREVA